MPDLMRLRLPRESLTSPVERQDHRGIGAFDSQHGVRAPVTARVRSRFHYRPAGPFPAALPKPR
jgi:hypothetical protein